MKEFRKEGSKGTRVWRISASKGEVYYESGQLGGKMTPSSRSGEYKNVGRSNAVTPEQDAVNWMERQIELKTRQGYREVDPKTGEWKGAETSLDWSQSPPENFRIYKPQNSLGAGLRKKLEAGKAWALRKRNGNGVLAYTSATGDMSLLTLTMQDSQKNEDTPYRVRYPKIEEALRLVNTPPKSIICGELVVRLDVDEYGFHVDDLDLVNGIRGSLTDEAIATQEEYGQLGLCIWDIAWWGEENWLETKTYQERFEAIKEIVGKELNDFLTFPEVAWVNSEGDWDDSPLVSIGVGSPNPEMELEFSIEHMNTVEQTLCDIAVTLGWEGFVIIDPYVLYGDKAFNFKGKADRPACVAKLKPTYEGDFIVRWDPKNGIGRKGKGKKAKGVGSLQAYLMHPEKGEIEISLVGGGLEDKEVFSLAKPKIYPLVAQVEFGSWTKSGSLQFPEFVRIRDDKSPEECSVEQNPKWREHYG